MGAKRWGPRFAQRTLGREPPAGGLRANGGAEAQAREFAGSRLRRVIAISCFPATFARDAAILVEGGYELKEVLPVDQFKWSAHVELAAVFARASKPR